MEAPVPAAEPGRALPLAVRLVTIYALVVGAALLVVAALAIQLTRSHLHRQLEAGMVAVARSFADGPAATITTPDQVAQAARTWLETQPSPADQAVIIRTATGEVLSTRSGLALGAVEGSADLLASSEEGWSTLDGDGSDGSDGSDGPDGSVLALTVPLTLNQADAGTLVVAASTARVDAGVDDLLRQVLWACAAGFLLAVVLGLLAVRRTLRPLEQMAGDIDRLQANTDVTERVRVSGPADEVGRLGLAFNRTLARLQHVVASQRQFVADASHELRTPLTVARGQLELLVEDEGRTDLEITRSVDLAIGELDRMGRMVGDLLLLARLDEGIELSQEEVDVELVVGEALLRAMPPGASAGASVEVDVPTGVRVIADDEGLLQVLTNLVANAVRHGGGAVAIAAHQRESIVAIAVADDGPGIPPDDLPHIFERFYRGEQRRDHDGGTGLGLAIVKGFTERMGGRIHVRSAAGAGTTFTVELRAAVSGTP